LFENPNKIYKLLGRQKVVKVQGKDMKVEGGLLETWKRKGVGRRKENRLSMLKGHETHCGDVVVKILWRSTKMQTAIITTGPEILKRLIKGCSEQLMPKFRVMLGLVVHLCNLRIRETEPGGSQVQG
jgi:hypothetical protein